LLLADGSTKIIPGHGPVGNREDLRAFRDMLLAAEQRVTKLVSEGKTLQQIVDAKPLADYDAKWGGGYMNPGRFLETLYADLNR
jgi:cyclase